MVFSETTNANMRRVHQLSGQAVKVTANTTGMIHKMIDMGIDRVSKPKAKQADRGSLPPGSTPPGTPPRPPRLLNRLLISTDLLLTTLEQSANQLVTHGTDAAATVAGHKCALFCTNIHHAYTHAPSTGMAPKPESRLGR